VPPKDIFPVPPRDIFPVPFRVPWKDYLPEKLKDEED